MQAANASKYMTVSDGLGFVSVTPRQWFNDANTSTWFFIPGLVVLIMTLVGLFLTTMVMAREWERGTLEALFITPVRPIRNNFFRMIPLLSASPRIGVLGSAWRRRVTYTACLCTVHS